MNSLKKSLRKNRKNKKLFIETTKLKLPKLPIVTRWGSWINFAIFISKNFTKVLNYVKRLDLESERKNYILELVESQEVKNSLFEVQTFDYLLLNIKKLEKNDLTLEEQIEILNNTEINGNMLIKNKLRESLEKNPDIDFFIRYKEINPDLRNKIEYVKLTSVDVERSFSALSHIFSDKRRSLCVENLNYMLVLYYNKI